MKKLILVCFIVFSIVDVFIVCGPHIISAIKKKERGKSKGKKERSLFKKNERFRN